MGSHVWILLKLWLELHCSVFCSINLGISFSLADLENMGSSSLDPSKTHSSGNFTIQMEPVLSISQHRALPTSPLILVQIVHGFRPSHQVPSSKHPISSLANCILRKQFLSHPSLHTWKRATKKRTDLYCNHCIHHERVLDFHHSRRASELPRNSRHSLAVAPFPSRTNCTRMGKFDRRSCCWRGSC